MNKYIYIIFISCTFLSCKKASERRCLKSSGPDSAVLTEINEEFDTLYLYDAIDYELVQDTVNELEIMGGENLIPYVLNEITNGTLTIRNDNKCNFLRSFKRKIKIRIHFKELNYIYFEGSASLISKNTIESNSFRLRIRDNAGSANLTIAAGYLETTISNGNGDFTLKGTAQNAFLHCNANSFCDTRNFQVSNDLIVRSNTQGDMYINADQVNLKATILQAGNIKYIGTPITKDVNISGEGQLIDLGN